MGKERGNRKKEGILDWVYYFMIELMELYQSVLNIGILQTLFPIISTSPQISNSQQYTVFVNQILVK